MDFGEFMGLAVVMGVLFVIFPAVLFSGIARVKAAKNKGGDALRMSELNAIIDDAVSRETSALRKRIEVLEEIATSRNDDFKLLNATPPTLTLPPVEEEEEAPAGAPSRTPARA